jgi:hypothetical protein
MLPSQVVCNTASTGMQEETIINTEKLVVHIINSIMTITVPIMTFTQAMVDSTHSDIIRQSGRLEVHGPMEHGTDSSIHSVLAQVKESTVDA